MLDRQTLFLAAALLAAGCDPPAPPPVPNEVPRVVQAAPIEPDPPDNAWPPPSPPSAVAETTAPPPDPLRRPWTTVFHDRSLSSRERVRGAQHRKDEEVKAIFAAADVPFPPRQLLLRVFKKERELEVWASGQRKGPLTRVATYTICAASGGPGPKTAEGDRQVPEGVYTIDGFNPASRFHLSMHVDYPNARDRAQRSTGGQIMIHGDCRSLGCVAIGDERIEELWLIARALRGGRPRVHAYPGRDLDRFIADTEDANLAAFWRGLRVVKAAFDADHEIPRVTAGTDGVYRVDQR